MQLVKKHIVIILRNLLLNIINLQPIERLFNLNI